MSKTKIDETEVLEALTVAELKELAEEQGIEIPSDTRKAEIIEAIQAGAGKKTGKSPEGKNVYEFQMSSTVEALCNQDDFWRIKLVS